MDPMLGGSLVTMAWCILRFVDGGDGIQIWRVVANILNKQLRTANKGSPPDLGLGMGLTDTRCKK
jgi:hypothetical protein